MEKKMETIIMAYIGRVSGPDKSLFMLRPILQPES